MKITKGQAKSFESLDSYASKRLGEKENESTKKEAAAYLEVLGMMQEEISSQVAKYMAKENIGFNELTRRLDTSSRQTAKIMKGEANLTLGFLAMLGKVMGKKPHIIFK